KIENFGAEEQYSGSPVRISFRTSRRTEMSCEHVSISCITFHVNSGLIRFRFALLSLDSFVFFVPLYSECVVRLHPTSFNLQLLHSFGEHRNQLTAFS